jgi:adenosylhomocysteine nucleosidase
LGQSIIKDHIGIIIPTQLELEPLLSYLPECSRAIKHSWDLYKCWPAQGQITIIVSYIGPANAAAATERLIADFNPDVILHGGCAGAINPELMPGDIVVGKSCKFLCSRHILEVRKSLLKTAKPVRYTQDGEEVHLDQLKTDALLFGLAMNAAEKSAQGDQFWTAGGWPSHIEQRRANVIGGTLGSQDGWTKGKEELDFLRTEFGADSEDMESAYVAQIAAKHSVPFVAVRAISNNEHIQTLQKSEILPAVKAASVRAGKALYELTSILHDPSIDD